ncbi:hypothetical protein ACG74X_10885 [Marivita sp. S0852]|uniref:hypothetical protein n=1 Tax=Marivita sp. S0852 TaxID=3373893 RepID=UPI0039826A46
MSAEKTNVEKQAKRHRPALWGIGAVVAFAGILLIAFLVSVTGTSEDDVEQLISTEETEG